MTSRDFAALASRILALVTLVAYLHVICASSAAVVLGAWDLAFSPYRIFPDFEHYALGTSFLAIPGLLYLAVCWFLWSRADWIASKLTSGLGSGVPIPNMALEDMQVLAFTVVGLLALLNAIRYLAGSLSFVLRGEIMTLHGWVTHQATLSAFASLILGVLLLTGSRGLIRFVHMLRIAGRPPSPGDDTYEPPRESEIA